MRKRRASRVWGEQPRLLATPWHLTTPELRLQSTARTRGSRRRTCHYRGVSATHQKRDSGPCQSRSWSRSFQSCSVRQRCSSSSHHRWLVLQHSSRASCSSWRQCSACSLRGPWCSIASCSLWSAFAMRCWQSSSARRPRRPGPAVNIKAPANMGTASGAILESGFFVFDIVPNLLCGERVTGVQTGIVH